MLRLDATKMILSHLNDEVVISNLGPTTDELWISGHRDRNFYTYGSMGLCSSMALGMALSTDEKIVSLDGDGSLLMNMGTLATIARENPKNLVVIAWDNEEWCQTGHQKTHTAFSTDLEKVAAGCGIEKTATVRDMESLEGILVRALAEDGPWFINAKIDEGEEYPVMPIEPEVTLYRFRRTFTDIPTGHSPPPQKADPRPVPRTGPDPPRSALRSRLR